MWNRFSEAWCKAMHNKPMWPINGKYVCSQCLREHSVTWEGLPRPAEYADPALRTATAAHHAMPAPSVSMDVCA
jgi:hypothetical protein